MNAEFCWQIVRGTASRMYLQAKILVSVIVLSTLTALIIPAIAAPILVTVHFAEISTTTSEGGFKQYHGDVWLGLAGVIANIIWAAILLNAADTWLSLKRDGANADEEVSVR